MFCFIVFVIFGLLVFFAIFKQIQTRKFFFWRVSFFSIIFLIIFLLSGFFTIKGIYNLIKYGACEKPEMIFQGEAGPLAIGGRCPFNQEILCIFLDEEVLKALNLPQPPNESIERIYKRLPMILQWRIMANASQRLNPEDKKVFEKFLREGEGYEIQLLFYKKIPDYKAIIEEELKKLREETIKIIYEENTQR